MAAQQLDLFAGAGYGAAAAPPRREAGPEAAALADDALIDALSSATLVSAAGLAAEAARRRLRAAVPALERLCRRLIGYGAEKIVPEQREALLALAAIGGADARQTVMRLIVAHIVQGPTLALALDVAAKLHTALPAARLAQLLTDPDPSVRAGACRCAHSPTSIVVDVLVQLLDDLHAPIANAAACALGRIGRAEARPALLRLLRAAPSAEIIDALVPIADPDAVVILRRIARTIPDLAVVATTALDEIAS